jgi:hypothetical protein
MKDGLVFGEGLYEITGGVTLGLFIILGFLEKGIAAC